MCDWDAPEANVQLSFQMSGMFETWLGSLVSALQEREKDANVVVVDWLSLAHQLYTDAVNNTQVVGKSIARLLNWLQVICSAVMLCVCQQVRKALM